MAKILLLEDDQALARGIAFLLGKEAHEVKCAYSCAEALALAESQTFDLALLDVNLPDGSGLDVCRALKDTTDMPVMFLTANDTEQDMIRGFELGCDDYLPKPFSLDILRHRVAAVLRRTVSGGELPAGAGNEKFAYREMIVDFGRMAVWIAGSEIHLTATEFRLLELLARHRGQVLTRDALLEQLWDAYGNFVDENALSVYVRRLRQKIEPDASNPVYILTVFGIGYTLGDSQ